MDLISKPVLLKFKVDVEQILQWYMWAVSKPHYLDPDLDLDLDLDHVTDKILNPTKTGTYLECSTLRIGRLSAVFWTCSRVPLPRASPSLPQLSPRPVLLSSH